MAPYITILIFTIIGFFLWGFKGLFFGFIIGKIFTFLFGLLMWPIGKIFDIGPMKKTFRKAIAQNFIKENLELIESIPKYNKMSNTELVNKFARYINEIFDSAIKIKDPIKQHNYDLDSATYKNNFLRGGIEIWAKSFSDAKESGLMSHFVMFCVNEIYNEFYKYEGIS